MSPLKTVVLAMLLGSTALISPSHAAETAAPTSAIRSTVSPEAAKTQTLLDRAESHLREKGDQAMASFSRAGEFVDGELYVYVIDIEGNFLASAGSSTTLIGRNVTDLTDSQGRHFIREILDGAKTQPAGRVEYRWNNPIRGRIEPKIATYRRVGDRILVVGYYAPYATFELAKSLVWRAVHELNVSGEVALSRFNNLNGGFVQDDLYVFVIGLEDGIVHAHGGQPRQVGRKAGDVTDANGKRFLLEMIEVAKKHGEGEVSYTFRNPLTLKNENKRSYIVRVGNYLVGAGAYVGPAK
jgi:cytochrome c